MRPATGQLRRVRGGVADSPHAAASQRRRHLGPVTIALTRRLGQGALHHLCQVRRYSAGQRRRRVANVAQRQLHGGVTVEGRVPGEHLVEHHADAIDVGALDPLGILGPPWLDHLHGHRPRQPAIPAAIYAPEGPLADQLVELVAILEGDP